MFIGFDLIPLFISLATQFLFKPKTPTQKIGKREDKNIDPSGYTTAITFLFGKVRVPTLRAIARPLKERKKTKKKKGQKQKIYTYFFTGCLEVGIPLVDEGNGYRQAFKLVQIWADNEVYFDINRDPVELRFDSGGRFKSMYSADKKFTFYSGGADHDVDPLISTELGNANIRYNGRVFMVFDDLPIQKWGNLPEFEVVIEPYEPSNKVYMIDLIRSLFVLANLPPTSAIVDSSLSNVKVDGFHFQASDNSAKDLLEKFLMYANARVVQKAGQVIFSLQSAIDSNRIKQFQSSLDCVSTEVFSSEGDTESFKNSGFTIRYADLGRNLDKSEYTHQLNSNGGYEQNIESIDFGNYSMNVSKAYRIAEYATSQNQFRASKHKFRLLPRFNIDILPNDLIVINDDITHKMVFLGIVEGVTINQDWTIDVVFSDFPRQIALSSLESNDTALTQASSYVASNGVLKPYGLPLLSPDDFTSTPAFSRGVYVIPEVEVGRVDVYLSYDNGLSYQLVTDLSGQRIVLSSITTIPAGTGYNSGATAQFTLSPSEVNTLVSSLSDSDVDEGATLIYNEAQGEVLSIREFIKINNNTVEARGIKRQHSGAFNGAYSSGVGFEVIKVDYSDLAEVLRLPTGFATGQTVYYKLTAAGEAFNSNAPQLTFAFPGTI